jgi:hypothetical protein
MAEAQSNFTPPNPIERAFGRLLVFLIRMGVVRGHFFVLEVRGRKTGKIFALPVDPLDLDGQRYLVCPRGESGWVKNLRAAGELTLVRALRRTRYSVTEIAANERAPILKTYLDRFSAEVQRFFPVPKGSPVEAFNALAPRYPVFRLDQAPSRN